jgi:hypothetical protein
VIWASDGGSARPSGDVLSFAIGDSIARARARASVQRTADVRSR